MNDRDRERLPDDRDIPQQHELAQTLPGCRLDKIARSFGPYPSHHCPPLLSLCIHEAVSVGGAPFTGILSSACGRSNNSPARLRFIEKTAYFDLAA